jgi:hypothetical protein
VETGIFFNQKAMSDQRDLRYLRNDYACDEWAVMCFEKKKLNEMYFDDEADVLTFRCPYCPDATIVIDEDDGETEVKKMKCRVVRHLLSQTHRFNEYSKKNPELFQTTKKNDVLSNSEKHITNDEKNHIHDCDLCGEKFSSEKFLVQHLKTKSHLVKMIENEGDIKIVVKSRDLFVKVPITTEEEDDEIETYHCWETFYDKSRPKGDRNTPRELWSCSTCNKNANPSAHKKFYSREEMAVHIKTAYHQKWLWLNENPEMRYLWGGATTCFASTTLQCEICGWKKHGGHPSEGLAHYTSPEHNQRVLEVCSSNE